MKKTIIATLVGSLIIFAFYSLSWMALPIHTNSMKYTPAQDSMLAMFQQTFSENGMYMLPLVDPNDPDREAKGQALYEQMGGKPWAMVQYNTSHPAGMGGQMFWGFILSLLSVYIVVHVLGSTSGANGTFFSRFFTVFLFGVFLSIQFFTGMNWWQTPWHYISGEVIDALLAWGLCGLWLGWYMGKD